MVTTTRTDLILPSGSGAMATGTPALSRASMAS